jgi:serine/threonine-protein kinase RsbW
MCAMDGNAVYGNRLPGRKPEPLAKSAVSSVSARWRRVFPGEARQLQVMRQWLRALLPESRERDDIICVATELCSNAVRHTASGRAGHFCVEITREPGLTRVAVADYGAGKGPRVASDPDGEGGRGLRLVVALSARTGVRGGPAGRVVWAEIPRAGTGPGSLPRRPGEEISAGLAMLAARFPGSDGVARGFD